MPTLHLSTGEPVLIDDDDFELVGRHRWFPLRSKGDVYARRQIRVGERRFTVLMHRFLLGVADSDVRVDHRNHNTLDNRRENLRVGTHAENLANRREPLAASGYFGVRPRGRRWAAQVGNVHVGTYDDPVTAARARDEVAVELYGEFASLNFA